MFHLRSFVLTKFDPHKQVSLLLDVLPEVAKEECFALYGGTAINLFLRNMPRLSVDIDLSYLPRDDRQTALNNINSAFNRIKSNIETLISGVSVKITATEKEPKLIKLSVDRNGVKIKIEFDAIKRGLNFNVNHYSLCSSAQSEFGSVCSIRLLDPGLIYGGKIHAALTRQHPRDLFDINQLLDDGPISRNTIDGFILCAISSDVSLVKILNPPVPSQNLTGCNFSTCFNGMTDYEFDYNDALNTLNSLVTEVSSFLTPSDREFLWNFQNCSLDGAPNWIFDDWESLSGVQWRLQKLERNKNDNPDEYSNSSALLKSYLFD